MKFISEEYGSKCNLLKLTWKEYQELEPFLLSLGVRSRFTISYSEPNEETGKMEEVCIIQAENPYKFWINENERKIAEKELTPFSIACYKR